MSFSGFTPSDFKVFEIPDFKSRMDAIRTRIRPKLEAALRNMEGLLTAEQKQARADGLKAGKPRRESPCSMTVFSQRKFRTSAAARDVDA